MTKPPVGVGCPTCGAMPDEPCVHSPGGGMSLFARVGAIVVAEVMAQMIDCPIHGWTVRIDACGCLLAPDADPPVMLSDELAACAMHADLFDQDRDQPDDFTGRCRRCVLARTGPRPAPPVPYDPTKDRRRSV